jgi:prepilin peptidase CpaA
MLASPSLHLSIVLIFVGILVAAGYGDLKRFLIPNRFPAALVLLYPAHILTAVSPIDAVSAGALALAVFLAGAGLFAGGLMGGGDVKLLAATALWAGPGLFIEFIAVTTVTGGAIAGLLLMPRGTWIGAIAQRAQAGAGSGSGGVPAQGEDTLKTRFRQPMPYGVAIALAGVLVAARLIAR